MSERAQVLGSCKDPQTGAESRERFGGGGEGLWFVFKSKVGQFIIIMWSEMACVWKKWKLQKGRLVEQVPKGQEAALG